MFTSFAKRKVMARTNIVKNFDLSFEINFNIIICAHHVDKRFGHQISGKLY